jgi:autotransporter-associated beta strand protein
LELRLVDFQSKKAVSVYPFPKEHVMSTVSSGDSRMFRQGMNWARRATAWFVIAPALAAGCLLLSPVPSLAQVTYWQVQSGDWSDPSNWSYYVPGVYSDAYIDNNGTATVTSSVQFFSTLYVGVFQSGNVNMVGGNLTGPLAYIGFGGVGSFYQSGGVNVLASPPSGGGLIRMAGTIVPGDASNPDGYLYVGYSNGSSGTYNLSGGQLSAGFETVGTYGQGTFQQSGGTNTVTGSLSIQDGGTYSLNFGQLSAFYVGVYNTGVFTQYGGTSSFNTIEVGGSSVGAYTLTDGQLSVGYENIGANGNGTFTQSGGTNSVGIPGIGGTGLSLGTYSASDNGTYILSGGQLLAPESVEQVGSSGTGTFTHSGGTNVANAIYLACSVGSSGTYNLSGNGQVFAGSECVGSSGTGVFTQSGGTNSGPAIALPYNWIMYSNVNLILGNNVGSTGTYDLSGGQLYGNTTVGNSGTGTFTQSGGTSCGAPPLSGFPNTAGTLLLGRNAGGSGTYNLNGGLLVLSALSQGSGSAAFNFNGGTLQAGNSFSSSLPMALGTSGSGATFNPAGYAMVISGPLSGPGSLTVTGNGTLLLTGSNSYSGGTTIAGGAISINADTALGDPSGSLTFTGSGTLQAGAEGITLNSAREITINSDAVATIDTASYNNMTLAGPIGGQGALTKMGSGGLTLSGNNTYSGSTTITAGTLNVNGSVAPAAAVTVNSGATLSGTGSVGSVVNGGSVITGTNVPGQLTIAGNYTQQSSGALGIRVNGTAASGNFDSLAISGTTSLAGSLNVTLGNGYTPTSGDPFHILSSTSLSGGFNASSSQVGIPLNRVVQATSNGSPAGSFNVNYINNSVTLVYQPLLMLASLSNNIYSGTTRFGTYSYVNNVPGGVDPNNLGYLANAYVSADGSQVVVAIRGTYAGDNVALLKNIAADVSFAGSVPSPLLVSEVADAATFVKNVETAYPQADITLTGHSLGGAVAQLVGEASGLDTYAFDAPGAQQLYSSLSGSLQVGSWGTSVTGQINTDYRLYGDQVSLMGTPIGNTVTIVNPTQPTFLSLMDLQYIGDAHSISTLISQIQSNPNNPPISTAPAGQLPELNVAQPLEAMLTGTPGGAGVYSFTFVVTNVVAKMLLDPTGGTDFTFMENSGSPNLASITLPTLDGVAGYDVRYLQNGVWSGFQLIEPGIEDDLPLGVAGIDLYAVDSSGEKVTLSDFMFQESFDSTGTVSATLTEATVPEPASLTLLGAALLGPGIVYLRRRRAKA